MKSAKIISMDTLTEPTYIEPMDIEQVDQKLDVERIRQDFPILNQTVYDQPLVYFDNAATTQKPVQVIDAISEFYKTSYANVHRGVHALSGRATKAYEEARETVKQFINAPRHEEIIFVRGATEAINLVASSLSNQLSEGDEIIVTMMEHHANIVPWQMACEKTGATLRAIPIDTHGELCLEQLEAYLTPKTKMLALTHVSNALGTINPIKSIINKAHQLNIPVLIDGAQSCPHMAIDVQQLDCDYFVFSGHKMYGPSGVGVLYGKFDLLNNLPPYQGGGEMILSVSIEKSVYNRLPYKFEAGTPNIAGAIGLKHTIDYLNQIGLAKIQAYEHDLLSYATQKISAIEGISIIGTAAQKAALISFTIKNAHPHDIGTVMDQSGVAIRAGHHCAMPAMKFFKLPATARASFAFYNTKAEVDQFISAIYRVKELFD